MWATPQERALQLKQQQKILREQEWNAKPEYEKRKMVVAIDLAGRKVTRSMAEMEKPEFDDEDGDDDDNDDSGGAGESMVKSEAGGTFSRNPLLGGLIRPTYPVDKGKGVVREEENEDRRQQTWRRVQDDYDDNEQLILDGGVYGRRQEQEDQPVVCG